MIMFSSLWQLPTVCECHLPLLVHHECKTFINENHSTNLSQSSIILAHRSRRLYCYAQFGLLGAILMVWQIQFNSIQLFKVALMKIRGIRIHMMHLPYVRSNTSSNSRKGIFPALIYRTTNIYFSWAIFTSLASIWSAKWSTLPTDAESSYTFLVITKINYKYPM